MIFREVRIRVTIDIFTAWQIRGKKRNRRFSPVKLRQGRQHAVGLSTVT